MNRFMKKIMLILSVAVGMMLLFPALDSYAATTRWYIDGEAIPYGTKIYFTDKDGKVNGNIKDRSGNIYPLFKVYYNNQLIYEYGNFVYYHTPADTYHSEDGKYWTYKEFVICGEQPVDYADSPSDASSGAYTYGRWDSCSSDIYTDSSGRSFSWDGWAYKNAKSTSISKPSMTGDEIHVYGIYKHFHTGSNNTFGLCYRGSSYQVDKYCTGTKHSTGDTKEDSDGHTLHKYKCDVCGDVTWQRSNSSHQCHEVIGTETRYNLSCGYGNGEQLKETSWYRY